MYKAANNVWVTVGSQLGDDPVNDDALALTAGHGARLSAFLGASDFTYLTLVKSTGEIEIIKAMQPTGDDVPVTRAQSGTTPRVWNVGERAEVRPVAAIFEDIMKVGLVPNSANGAGTSNAFTATFAEATQPSLEDRMVFIVEFPSGNTIAAPTLNVTLGSTATGAKSIVKEADQLLEPGDIPGAGFVGLLRYDSGEDKYVLMNPQGKIKRAYREVRQIVAAAGAAQALDCAVANHHQLTLNAASCALTLTNVPSDVAYGLTVVLIQDATGGRAVTWPGSVRWPDGVTPVLTPTANKRDVFALLTYDGGATWLGFSAGVNL